MLHKRPRLSLSLYDRRNLWGLVFVLPAIVFFVVFAYYPLASALHLSFQQWNLIAPPKPLEWGNYDFLLSNRRFLTVLGNSFEFVAAFAVLPGSSG